MLNKKVFTTKDDKGNEVELAILRASPKQMIDAQLVYNREWRKAQENGSYLRINLDDVAKKQGLWDEDKAEKVKGLETEILKLERKLRGGAASLSSKFEGRGVALKVRDLRAERLNLLIAKNSLDRITAESFADSARIQYLVAATTVYNNDGRSFYKSYEDFIEKSNDQSSGDAMNAYLELVLGDNKQEEDELYENIYLKKYGYADDKNRLINSEGKLVDDDGRLINENGRYINDKNEYVDREGNLVDEKGNFIIEHKEFEDEIKTD